jgi:ArsR family transcriptional regulator, lead/cadmium/zinc/bismuth-responsive transcriptional repressor
MSAKENIRLLKALSEESRYRIVELLLKGEKCACEIPGIIGRTQSNTSMHLTKLADLEILQSRREGKMIIYSIKDMRVCDVFKSFGYPEAEHLNARCCMNKKKRGK